jgi:hypothetical protein
MKNIIFCSVLFCSIDSFGWFCCDDLPSKDKNDWDNKDLEQIAEDFQKKDYGPGKKLVIMEPHRKEKDPAYSNQMFAWDQDFTLDNAIQFCSGNLHGYPKIPDDDKKYCPEEIVLYLDGKIANKVTYNDENLGAKKLKDIYDEYAQKTSGVLRISYAVKKSICC